MLSSDIPFDGAAGIPVPKSLLLAAVDKLRVMLRSVSARKVVKECRKRAAFMSRSGELGAFFGDSHRVAEMLQLCENNELTDNDIASLLATDMGLSGDEGTCDFLREMVRAIRDEMFRPLSVRDSQLARSVGHAVMVQSDRLADKFVDAVTGDFDTATRLNLVAESGYSGEQLAAMAEASGRTTEYGSMLGALVDLIGERRLPSPQVLERLSRNPGFASFMYRTAISVGQYDCANAIAGQLDGKSAEFLQRIPRVFLREEPFDELPDVDGVEQADDRDTLLLALAEAYYRMRLFDFAARHFRACLQPLNPVAQLHWAISGAWSDMGTSCVHDAKARAIELLGAFPLWACDDDRRAYVLAVQALSEGLPEDDVNAVLASASPEVRRLLRPLELLVELRSCSAERAKEICEIGFQGEDLSLAMASAYRLRRDPDSGRDMLCDLFEKWPEARFLAMPIFKCYLEVSRPSISPDDAERWRSRFDDVNLFDLVVGNYLRKDGDDLHTDFLGSFIDHTVAGDFTALLNEPREAFEAASALGRMDELARAVDDIPLLPAFAVPGLMTQLVNRHAPSDIVDRIIERYGEALSQSPEFVEDCAAHYHNAKRYRRALDSAIAAFGLRPSRLAAEVCLHASLALGEKLPSEVEDFVVESNRGDLIAQASRLARALHNASRADSLIMRALLCEDPSCPDAMLEYVSVCHGEGFPSPERVGGNTVVVLESRPGETRMLAFHDETSDLPGIPTLHGGYEHLSVGSAEYQSLRGKAASAAWEWRGVRYKVALVEDLRGVMFRYCLANSDRIPGAKVLLVDPEDPESLFNELRKLQGGGIDRHEILAEGIETKAGVKQPVGFWSASGLFGMNPVELAIKLVHDMEVPVYRYPANRRYAPAGSRGFLLSASAIMLAALAKPPESVLDEIARNAVATARTKAMLTGCVESFIAGVEKSSGYLGFNSDGDALYSETTPEMVEFLKRDTDAILSLLGSLRVVESDDEAELIAEELQVFDPVVRSDICTAKSLSLVYVTEDYWECRILEELDLLDWCDLQALLGSSVGARHDEMTFAFHLANLFCVPSFDGPLRDWMADSRLSLASSTGVLAEDAGDSR